MGALCTTLDTTLISGCSGKAVQMDNAGRVFASDQHPPSSSDSCTVPWTRLSRFACCPALDAVLHCLTVGWKTRLLLTAPVELLAPPPAAPACFFINNHLVGSFQFMALF
ncbi:hypothetical protein DMENIID0001_017150 [Sergentomyia squamirostris]